mmetsp:Transcript_96337/g.166093  ORF Transcript_96337/g.166093 Transcript_96337/m.166093 type:complete len:341 (+) Transcript_96337:2063-3085(+)
MVGGHDEVRVGVGGHPRLQSLQLGDDAVDGRAIFGAVISMRIALRVDVAELGQEQLVPRVKGRDRGLHAGLIGREGGLVAKPLGAVPIRHPCSAAVDRQAAGTLKELIPGISPGNPIELALAERVEGVRRRPAEDGVPGRQGELLPIDRVPQEPGILGGDPGDKRDPIGDGGGGEAGQQLVHDRVIAQGGDPVLEGRVVLQRSVLEPGHHHHEHLGGPHRVGRVRTIRDGILLEVLLVVVVDVAAGHAAGLPGIDLGVLVDHAEAYNHQREHHQRHEGFHPPLVQGEHPPADRQELSVVTDVLDTHLLRPVNVHFGAAEIAVDQVVDCGVVVFVPKDAPH